MESQDKLQVLKEEATKKGITFHPSIGYEKLRMKVANADRISQQLANTTKEVEPEPVAQEVVKPVVQETVKPVVPEQPIKPMEMDKPPLIIIDAIEKTPEQLLAERRRLANKLIRVRVTCMNKNKKDWQGEIFSVGSAKIGTFKKFVPFDTEYHIPHIIYREIKERMCSSFITVKGPRGNKLTKAIQIKEFGVEVLDPLTQAELKQLADQQAVSGSIEK